MDDTNDKLSRRALFFGAAAATSATVLSACSSTPGVTGPNPDIIPLNLMLAREYTAIATYTAGISIFNAPPAGDPYTMDASALAAIATQWKAQHAQHAALLAAAITGIGGTPIVASAAPGFTAPTGFNGSILDVLKVATNAEKDQAVAYAGAVAQLSEAANRFIAGNIEGDETQHFIVLFALVNGLVTPGTALAAMGTANIVPEAFVVSPSSMPTTGLDTLANFTFT